MADSQLLPDEIIHYILARLPAKPLLRFQCVSKHWNSLLKEPYFMKLRSRIIIILPLDKTLQLIDENVPVDDTRHSILKRRYPLENLRPRNILVNIIGTFNGIVLLAYSQRMILYNPFTGTSKKLPHPPIKGNRGGYGFGYGATPDDLKIVRFRQHFDICDVYNFKKNSWSSWSTLQYNVNFIKFKHPVGTFLNGFLHWIEYNKDVLTVVNVEDMVLSKMNLPQEVGGTLLGTIDGCLCLLSVVSNTEFHMWVMNEYGVESSWSNTYKFDLKDTGSTFYRPHCILGSGRIIMKNASEQLIIYDISKHSYKMLNTSLSQEGYRRMFGVEYVESTVSPSDMCFSRLEGRKRKERK